MKIFLKKAYRSLEKVIGLVITALTLRFGGINPDNPPTGVNSDHYKYTELLNEESISEKTETDDQSVNSNRLKIKTGLGTVLRVVRKHDNKTSESLKSTLELRCGDETEEIKEEEPGTLARSILSKTKGSEYYKKEVSVGNFLKRIYKLVEPIFTNQKFWQLMNAKPVDQKLTVGQAPTQSSDVLTKSKTKSKGSSFSVEALSASAPLNGKKPNLVLENTRLLKTYDGLKAKLTDKSLSHLTAKHGHTFGIDDPLPLLPNQKPTKYTQIRTRINKINKGKFGNTLEKILMDPSTEVFPDVKIRGIQGRGYYTPNYDEYGAFIGIATEGKLEGQIIKAQPLSIIQLEILREFNKIE